MYFPLYIFKMIHNPSPLFNVSMNYFSHRKEFSITKSVRMLVYVTMAVSNRCDCRLPQNA